MVVKIERPSCPVFAQRRVAARTAFTAEPDMEDASSALALMIARFQSLRAHAATQPRSRCLPVRRDAAMAAGFAVVSPVSETGGRNAAIPSYQRLPSRGAQRRQHAAPIICRVNAQMLKTHLSPSAYAMPQHAVLS
jgi:hypothetical protein